MPIIHTSRLVLEPMALSDLDWFSEMRSDPDVMKYIGANGPLTREQSKEKLDRYLACWAERGMGMFGVRERGRTSPVGWGGLQPLAETGEIEVGYAFAKPAWGRGFATETATAVVRWGFEELGLERIVAVAYADNTASRRVMDKLGMRFEGMRYLYSTDSVYYSVTPAAFSLAASPQSANG
jgi:RimJ/RimL family protein N-acetyltransferase